MPEAAQWVAHEEWHHSAATQNPARRVTLEMRLPYADATELAMDILRHGTQVKVLAPAALAKLVATRLKDAAAQYA